LVAEMQGSGTPMEVKPVMKRTSVVSDSNDKLKNKQQAFGRIERLTLRP